VESSFPNSKEKLLNNMAPSENFLIFFDKVTSGKSVSELWFEFPLGNSQLLDLLLNAKLLFILLRKFSSILLRNDQTLEEKLTLKSAIVVENYFLRRDLFFVFFGF